ncbi:CPBP family intramembrane glutamic endopeptidase [Desulfosporosinus sp. BICA1-9]|uniref:CPBP family intramembrane glutamic endopeptidase n=1 Tax=Desulfosporosinus sp. BICA1-9 TaxID=1531958 RepID=UPI00054BE90A|nr:CPBP family intramembrane glutamic endopeptidase [Desulfosporosinus sp. BICA1-9]KJS48261.1 MAG: CAAX protease [Peptococcaceae bacterium BRH_c23]KJS89357.1 MAG: CAAX protease [Desulfosporosinus sp. BICA1-9]HBW37294.1 CPBP family intramembrane metalloprotease [Desulfosporosinus sp.]
MDEESESKVVGSEFLLNKRNLSWIDLVLILGGVICIYVLLSFGTIWLMDRWPHERALIYLNAFMTQLAFALLILLLKRIRHWEWSDFGWKAVPFRKYFYSVIGLYLFSWVINISYAIVLYNYGLTPPETDVYSKLLGQATGYTLFLNLLLAGILAPIVEETLFRGVIFGSLQAYFGKWTAATISAVIFSALHFQVYGFFPRFVLGLVLIFLYTKFKSLYPPVTLHALNNTVATLIAAKLMID